MSNNNQQGQGGGELRRSKVQDFGISRERSFVRPQSHHHQGRGDKKRNHTSMSQHSVRGKPTMEIYRPPSVRLDGSQNGGIPQQQMGLPQHQNPKLNVHAKEFTMTQGDLQTSRSSVNLAHSFNNHQQALQHSKSSGNVLRNLHQQGTAGPPPPLTPTQIGPPPPLMHHPPPPHHVVMPGLPPLLQSASSGNILHSPRVHFQPPTMMSPQPQSTGAFFPGGAQLTASNAAAMYRPLRQPHVPPSQALKRSKSLSAADSLTSKLQSMNIGAEAPDLGKFPSDVEDNLKIAVEDPNKLSGRTLMDLVPIIMERIVEGRRYSLPGAKICIRIIEKEKNETFLESLINTCQQWYQERDKILRNVKMGEGSRFTAFMWFLTEMACQLKRRQLQLKTQHEGVPPGLVLLTLLVKCCQACVTPPKSLAETECLFFVLTSIGRDLEAELPAQLDLLLESVRDGFLASTAVPQIRKTLLQLIELKASNWQLPGSTVLYYYPKMK